MASNVSYSITKKNNQTEKIGIDYLLENDPCIWSIEKDTRKKLISILDIDDRFSRAFDLIRVEGSEEYEELQLSSDIDIVLIELKTTMKYLPDFPRGFFFGATDNEFQLARDLGERYKFCFLSLNEKSRSYCFLSLKELESIIRTKRIQYQINL